MDYTLEMFSKDHNELIPILQSANFVEIPEDEWPQFSIDGQGYSMNPNNSLVDTYRYFINKYQEKGDDFHWRFTSIIRFIQANIKTLEKEKLVEQDENGANIKKRLLTILLNSFSAPKTAEGFPISSLGNNKDTIILRKVMQRIRSDTKEN